MSRGAYTSRGPRAPPTPPLCPPTTREDVIFNRALQIPRRWRLTARFTAAAGLAAAVTLTGLPGIPVGDTAAADATRARLIAQNYRDGFYLGTWSAAGGAAALTAVSGP